MAEADYETMWIGAAEMRSIAEYHFVDKTLSWYLEPIVTSSFYKTGSYSWNATGRRGGFGYWNRDGSSPTTYRLGYWMGWEGWLPSGQGLIRVMGGGSDPTEANMAIILNLESCCLELWLWNGSALELTDIIYNIRPFLSGFREFKHVGIVCNTSGGWISIYLNAVHIGTFNYTPPNPLAVLIGSALDNGNYMYVDDAYVDFSSYSESNVAPPARRYYPALPDGAGSSSAWTPNGAVNNYECVNESTVPDDTTTYVSTSNNAVLDMYTFGSVSIPDNETPKSASIQIYARKNTQDGRDGFGSLRTAYKGLGPADYGDIINIYPFWPETKEWAVIFDNFKDVPSGSGWTLADFNGGQFGFQSEYLP